MATLHMTDKGHELLLGVFFRNDTAPTAFYVALGNDTVVGTDDWADISANEQAGTGYSRQTINRDSTANGWPTLALDSSEMQITGKQVTFTASADWATVVTFIALVADMATDRLVAYANIASMTVTNGQSFQVTPKVKLTKG